MCLIYCLQTASFTEKWNHNISTNIFKSKRNQSKYSLLKFSGLSFYRFEKYFCFNCQKIILGKKERKLQNLFMIGMVGNLNDHRLNGHSTSFDDFKK